LQPPLTRDSMFFHVPSVIERTAYTEKGGEFERERAFAPLISARLAPRTAFSPSPHTVFRVIAEPAARLRLAGFAARRSARLIS
jgi:hypothetical protein